MNKYSIYREAIYEFKRVRRSTVFRIFFILATAGLVFYHFSFLSRIGDVAGNWSQLYMDWTSRALPSAIAFKSAYYFNAIQLLLVVFLVLNDLVSFRLSTAKALQTRPQSNGEIALGNLLGKVLAVTILNWLAFGTSIVMNLLLYPRSFEGSYYLFYWGTLTFPTLVYLLGISSLVTCLVRSRGVSIVVIFLLLGSIIYICSDSLHGVFDPLALHVPNMFSDFTGHADLMNYLLQRGSILLTGCGLLAAAVVPFPRIPNKEKTSRTWISGACVLFALAGVLILVYNYHHNTVTCSRNKCMQEYDKYVGRHRAKMIRNELRLRELANGGIVASSTAVVTNENTTTVKLIMYLNPGFTVTSLKIDGTPVSFRREWQMLLLEKELAPGDTCTVMIAYEGVVDNMVCIPNTDYSEEVIGIFRHGNSPTFCEKAYKLLLPECAWYPSCSSPIDEEADFTRYSLDVEHNPQLVAISQGEIIEESEGKTSFRFTHDMPGISLCIGNYKKRTITVGANHYVDSLRATIYFHPEHEYLLDKYTCSREEINSQLLNLKHMLEEFQCIQYSAPWTKEELEMIQEMGGYTEDINKNIRITNTVLKKRGFNPSQHYPYRWLTLVEAPCHFHRCSGLLQASGERVQGGIVFVPEKLYTMKKHKYMIPRNEKEREESGAWALNDVRAIVDGGSCDVTPLLCGRTISLISAECPGMNKIIADMAYYVIQLGAEFSFDDEFQAVDYLKNHSLRDAMHDKRLSPKQIQDITRKKCAELCVHVKSQVNEKAFRQFHLDFLKEHLFQEVPLEEYFRQFHKTLGFNLDSLVKKWYNADRLPLLELRDVQLIKLIDEPFRLEAMYIFKVFNKSDVPGIISTGDNQCWIIPPHEGREIRSRYRKRIQSSQMYFFLETPMAENLPSHVRLSLESANFSRTDTTSAVLPLDSVTFYQGDPRRDEVIIVDNEDHGFRVVKAKGFSLVSLFKKESECKKYEQRRDRQEVWQSSIDSKFHGFPVRSAYSKQAGEGKLKVEWSTQLPRDGKYEVLFYHPRVFNEPMQEFYYTIHDGKEEHEVMVPVDANIEDWVSIGVFDFHGYAKVVLSDRDRKNKVKNANGYSPQELVADAVKWIKIKEKDFK